MMWPLPELPMRWEALPCPLAAGWALIRLWERPKRADNGMSLLAGLCQTIKSLLCGRGLEPGPLQQ